MNTILEIYENLTDSQLEEIIREIHSSNETGYINTESLLRSIIQNVCTITNQNYAAISYNVILEILKEFAFRQLKLK